MSGKQKILRAFVASCETRKEDSKPALVPKLRFPDFRDAEGWLVGKVDELIDTVTPPKKLPSSRYSTKGAYRIIDQSQSDICGWTDDHEALIQDGFPLIIFGDHTCILKLIDHPFAQGADGIKILKSRPKVGTAYLYQFLTYRPVVTEEYKRHYSILKEKIVSFPDAKTGEQQKIAECLSSMDELIAAQARELDALKTHRKGLMQELFPREGETQPRLRFPEFQNAGEWEEGDFADAIFFQEGPGILAVDFRDEGVPLVRLSGLAGQTVSLDGCNYLDPDKVEQKWSHFRLEAGDLLVSCSASFGRPATVTDVAAGAVFYTGLVRFKVKGGRLTVGYLEVFMGGDCFLRQAESFAVGSGIKHFGPTHLRKMKVPLPCLGEQQQIAACLTSLDDLIAAQTQMHEAFKTHKKGLMQQLFPSPEEMAP